MKTIERYVFGAFLSSFALSALVLTFVLTIGLLVQIVGFILDGIAPSLVGKFAMVSFPETLQWTIPLALLVSSVLVFSRLSADSEIAAMRACGINLLSVMRYPALFALLCTLLGAYLNNEIVPRGHEVRRSLKSKVSVETGLDVLEPGMWIDDFPKVKIYFGAKEGAWLRDLVVMDYSNPKVDRMIRASKALVTGEGRDVTLDLYSMTVDPLDENHPGMMRVNRYLYTVKDALKESKYTRKTKDFDFKEIVEAIRGAKAVEKTALDKLFAAKKAEMGWSDAEAASLFAADPQAKALRREIRRSRSKNMVELSKRFVFAAASLCFVLVGMPLGIRAQRRESTVGMAISLLVALGYYLVVMLMLSLEKTYVIRPDILMWLPVAASLALAFWFTKKHL
ncbi:MAG: LptF/LptG family permease [Kiritimatiellae bacterium]|nr:LptF/LptG family permease [Kiritimatiellia bacterium]